MGVLSDLRLIVICDEHRYDYFRAFIQRYADTGAVDLETLLEPYESISFELELPLDAELQKSARYHLTDQDFSTTEVTGSYTLEMTLNVRRIDHLYSGKIELEMEPRGHLSPFVRQLMLKQGPWNDWLVALSKLTEPKLMYLIEDYETFHLRYFEGKSQKMKFTDIDSFDSWSEAFEAFETLTRLRYPS